MKLRIFALAAASFLMATSCVSVKQQTYLQPLVESNSPQPAGAMPELPEYRLQPYDILRIQVKSSNPEIDALYNKQSGQQQMNMRQGPAPLYFMGYHVLPDGTVDVPGVGMVNVAGKSLPEAKEAITQSLAPLFSNPKSYHVDVVLAGIRYTVLGECVRPGIHYLYLDRGTILDALANAGDMTFLANRRKVQVLRQKNNQWERVSLDLTSADCMSNPSFYLQPNDIISVQPLPQKAWGFGQTGFSSFTSILGVVSSTLAIYFALNR
jgi:polysaccharide export outer membrane protein